MECLVPRLCPEASGDPVKDSEQVTMARFAFKESALVAVGEWVERATPGAENPGRRPGNSPSERR